MKLGKQNIRRVIVDTNNKTEVTSSKLFSYRLIQNATENLEEPMNYNKSTTFIKNERVLPNFLRRRKYIKRFEDSSEVYY